MHTPLTVKAIETVYRGYRFRSRLEARWAVFLTECGLKFDYEPEGYELDGIRYLPDFRVHAQHIPAAGIYQIRPDWQHDTIDSFWLEVKGQEFREGDDTWQKAQRLAKSTRLDVVVFAGQIEPYQPGVLFGWPKDNTPRQVRFIECPFCGAIQACERGSDPDCFCHGLVEARMRTTTAACKAKQARFEFGEQG